MERDKKILEQYLEFKKLRDQLAKKMEDLREELFKIIEKNGSEDDKGSIIFELDNITAKKEKRESVKVDNSEENIEFLKKKGLKDCIEVIEQIREDLLESAVLEGKLSAKDLMKMIEKKITWALKVDYAKQEKK